MVVGSCGGCRVFRNNVVHSMFLFVVPRTRRVVSIQRTIRLACRIQCREKNSTASLATGHERACAGGCCARGGGAPWESTIMAMIISVFFVYCSVHSPKSPDPPICRRTCRGFFPYFFDVNGKKSLDAEIFKLTKFGGT